MGNIFVPVDDTLYSTLPLGTPQFPFAIFHDDLAQYRDGFCNWHNQTSFEISLVLEGKVRVCLLEEEQVVPAGEAFAVMPDHLHAIKGEEGCAARYITMIVEPRLLYGYPGSFFDEAYCKPVWERNVGWFRIPQEPQLGPAFEAMTAVFNGDASTVEGKLAITHALQRLWMTLYEQVFSRVQRSPQRQNTRILSMIEYLRNHYAEKFSLSHMAAEHHVSRGECCRYFRRMMGMTPTEYLTEYRVGISTQLLSTTELSVTEIAQAVGFGSGSSFAAVFRAKTGLSPSAYRKEHIK